MILRMLHCFAFGIVVVMVCLIGSLPVPVAGEIASSAQEPNRSPVDLILTPDEQWLITANQTSDTVSLVKTATGEVVDEVSCGARPSALALGPDGVRVLVTGTYGGDLTILEIEDERLKTIGRVNLGFEPRGVAVAPDGKSAYVALTTADAVAVVDLERLEVVDRIAVGRWPRYLALSPDGSRLAVGTSGDRGVSVVDTEARRMLYQEQFSGINLGQMHVSGDGKYVYFPWMIYRHNRITPGNIRLGWVLASRIARVRLDGSARREAISLDPRGKAVSDPHGLALSPDEAWMVSAASGTQELLVYRLKNLPFQDYGGPGDHIDPALLSDSERFYRIPLGGRPMAVRYSGDGRRVFVANYLLNAVQEVDLEQRAVVRTFDLGGPEEPSLVRRGEAIFYDGRRSLDQWYSCHSCHYEGHTNAVTMDTLNDGSNRTFKTVLSLRNVAETGPWTWHGWQEDFEAGLRKSLQDTMLGPDPTDEDVEALSAFLETLEAPPNPHRLPDGTLTESARRGEVVFQSEKAGCIRCHSGPFFTDGLVHDVALSEESDVYRGFNTPSLLNVYDRAPYLHDGRAKTLEKMLTGPHNPAKVTGRGELTDAELRDLVAYLKSL